MRWLVFLFLVQGTWLSGVAWAEDPNLRITLRMEGAEAEALERARHRFEAVVLEESELRFAGDAEMEEVYAECREAIGVDVAEERKCRLNAARRLFVQQVLEIESFSCGEGCVELVLSVWDPHTNEKRFTAFTEVEAEGVAQAARLGFSELGRRYLCWHGGESCEDPKDLPDPKPDPDPEPEVDLAALCKAASPSEIEVACGAACEAGHAEGCFTLASWAREDDPASARSLYASACNKGSAMGCFHYGAMTTSGEGGDVDKAQARAAFVGACEGGILPACNNLAVAMVEGSGGPQDLSEARRLLEFSCEKGSGAACYNLAISLHRGSLGVLDLDAADASMIRACKLGYEDACE